MCSLIAKVFAKCCVERVSKEDMLTLLNSAHLDLLCPVIIGIHKTQFAETASTGSEGQRKFKQRMKFHLDKLRDAV